MPEVRTTSSTGGQKGVKLARFDLIPAGPLKELAEHYGRGARKYANHQWRQGYEWSKSIGALGRHFNDFMAGKDYDVCENDPDGCSHVDADGQPFEGEVTPNGSTCFNHTGSHHMAAVAWHSFLLLEFKDTHPQHDDRYAPEFQEEDAPESLTLGPDALWTLPEDFVAPQVVHRTGMWVLPEHVSTEALRILFGSTAQPRFEVTGVGVVTDFGPDLLGKHPTRWDRG